MSYGNYPLYLISLILLLTGCGGQGNQDDAELTIFAAASLTNAFTELAQTYTVEHNVAIQLNFAGSSQLASQIREGAPADVFASANPDQVEKVAQNGRVTQSDITPFVSNQLAIITPADNPANITELTDLTNAGTALILAATGVPVRDYTDTLVQSVLTAEQQASLYNNLVSAEDNVRQVAAKIALGEADAGIVYVSDITPDIQDRVRVISLSDTENVQALYTIAPLNDTAVPQEADRFIQFVLSPTGQEILRRWGFSPPPSP